MPDISLCRGIGCTKKETCHRWIARWGTLEYQSVFSPAPETCKYYWEAPEFKTLPSCKAELTKQVNLVNNKEHYESHT